MSVISCRRCGNNEFVACVKVQVCGRCGAPLNEGMLGETGIARAILLLFVPLVVSGGSVHAEQYQSKTCDYQGPTRSIFVDGPFSRELSPVRIGAPA
jgi:hypothetical protein